LGRFLLAEGAAVVAVAVGSAATGVAFSASPDAGLIALCADLDRLQHQIDALFPMDWTEMTDAGLGAADAAARPLEAEQRLILTQLCALTPVTMPGYAAMARSAVQLRPDLLCAGPHAGPDKRLMAAVVRGLMGRA